MRCGFLECHGHWLHACKLLQRVRKEPGCGMIDADGIVHEFLAGDRLHHQADEICRKVDEMAKRQKSVGYVPDTSQVLFEIGEEEKESALLRHSEKLAIAFGAFEYCQGDNHQDNQESQGVWRLSHSKKQSLFPKSWKRD